MRREAASPIYRLAFLYKIVIADSLQRVEGVSEGRMLGVRIGTRSLPELVSAAEAAMQERRESFVFACANPHSLVVAHADAEFRDALERADAVVADGVGCTWAAALAGTSVGPRITGSDFFVSVMTALNRTGGRAFFFGSRDEVLAKLVARVVHTFPRVGVATLSPPFRQWSGEENDEMMQRICQFEPHVLWVGMTAPKQEKWVALNAARLQVPVIGSIGAVFDYYAGVTQRAPQWICDLGLEWLYRLPREPKRLWRRTMISAPLFLWLVLRERIGR
jgi:N-acetylglucosaminyldiphosphoundecaprenol N-acetyl-beta-D-mannosaminyltransferase